MQIAIDKRAVSTDAYALLVEGWNDLVQRGYTPDGDAVCPVGRNDTVVYAYSDEGDVVGVLAVAWGDEGVFATVKLAYVEPSSRKRGVFKALLAEARSLADKKGFERLTLAVNPENAEFAAVMRRMNRPAVQVLYDLGV